VGGKITVTDLLGRTQATGRAEAYAKTRIDMKGRHGVFIVSILTSEGTHNTKVLVR